MVSVNHVCGERTKPQTCSVQVTRSRCILIDVSSGTVVDRHSRKSLSFSTPVAKRSQTADANGVGPDAATDATLDDSFPVPLGPSPVAVDTRSAQRRATHKRLQNELFGEMSDEETEDGLSDIGMSVSVSPE